ncbi:MAG: aspartyl protease family protein [Acidimicrobiia bacterium]
MGRIVTSVEVANALDVSRQIRFDALVDTGASGLVLPSAWKDRLGSLGATRMVELQTADQRVIEGEVGGPVSIQIKGFDRIFSEVTFVHMHPENGAYEPLVGYIILEQSRAAVDMVGHRLVTVKHFDLKRVAEIWTGGGALPL